MKVGRGQGVEHGRELLGQQRLLLHGRAAMGARTPATWSRHDDRGGRRVSRTNELADQRRKLLLDSCGPARATARDRAAYVGVFMTRNPCLGQGLRSAGNAR